MIKFAIEVQVEGVYVEAAEPQRRFKQALASLDSLTGAGIYRVRLGKRVWREKVVVREFSPELPFRDGAAVRFGARGKVEWEVFHAKADTVDLINNETGARKFAVPVAKLVLVHQAVAAKAA